MNIEISPKEYERKMNWEDAIFYCQLLVIDGKDDWRLPTIEELKEISNSENTFIESGYWSSIDIVPLVAWRVDMGYGNSFRTYKGSYHNVRAVRDI